MDEPCEADQEFADVLLARALQRKEFEEHAESDPYLGASREVSPEVEVVLPMYGPITPEEWDTAQMHPAE